MNELLRAKEGKDKSLYSYCTGAQEPVDETLKVAALQT